MYDIWAAGKRYSKDKSGQCRSKCQTHPQKQCLAKRRSRRRKSNGGWNDQCSCSTRGNDDPWSRHTCTKWIVNQVKQRLVLEKKYYFLQILQWWARGGFGERHFLQKDDTSPMFNLCKKNKYKINSSAHCLAFSKQAYIRWVPRTGYKCFVVVKCYIN